MRIDKYQTQTFQAGISTPREYLNRFETHVRNSADLNDTITVPRTIFKGYLGIMTGSTLLTLGGLSAKHPKISLPLNIAGILTSLYGTWAFVRPYIIKSSTMKK